MKFQASKVACFQLPFLSERQVFLTAGSANCEVASRPLFGVLYCEPQGKKTGSGSCLFAYLVGLLFRKRLGSPAWRAVTNAKGQRGSSTEWLGMISLDQAHSFTTMSSLFSARRVFPRVLIA